MVGRDCCGLLRAGAGEEVHDVKQGTGTWICCVVLGLLLPCPCFLRNVWFVVLSVVVGVSSVKYSINSGRVV